MATITVTVQSILNSATFNSYTVSDGITVSSFKNTVATAWGVNTNWFALRLGQAALSNTSTLAAAGVVSGSVLHVINLIARLPTLQDRQVAKLTLAQARRQAGGNTSAPFYRPHNVFNVSELPTQWVGNTLVDNPNTGGLLTGRPWV
jgi:hypothetical protein